VEVGLNRPLVPVEKWLAQLDFHAISKSKIIGYDALREPQKAPQGMLADVSHYTMGQ
jgi:hypothetical protein